MSKEKDMLQPNGLGQYHRDIQSAIKFDRYYMELTLSCGHTTHMSYQAYAQHRNHATLCIDCSDKNTTKTTGALFIDVPIPAMIRQPNGNSISTLRALKLAHEVILQSAVTGDNALEDKKIIALDDLQVMMEHVK